MLHVHLVLLNVLPVLFIFFFVSMLAESLLLKGLLVDLRDVRAAAPLGSRPLLLLLLIVLAVLVVAHVFLMLVLFNGLRAHHVVSAGLGTILLLPFFVVMLLLVVFISFLSAVLILLEHHQILLILLVLLHSRQLVHTATRLVPWEVGCGNVEAVVVLRTQE